MSGSGRITSPRRLSDVPERWVEDVRLPEARIIEREGYRDLYAISTKWCRETGLPIREGMVWCGYKGEFFSIWHAVVRLAKTDHPQLIHDLCDTENDDVEG